MKPLFPDIFVNGEKIPSADIAAEAQNHAAPAGKPGLAWRAGAQALVVRHLLLSAAATSGQTAKPATVSPGRIETEEEALIRAFLDDNLIPTEVADAEVLAIYRQRSPEGAPAPEIAIDIRRKLEQRAWSNAASDLVARLVSEAEISGIEMK